MTPDEIENLRLLRDAASGHIPLSHLKSESPQCEDFYAAAHAALGPEGCVTRELERLRADSAVLAEAGDRYIAKHNAVSEAYADYRTTTDEVIATLQRHTKDAQKENAILLARLVKVSAAARSVCAEDDKGCLLSGGTIDALRAVLNEIPPPSNEPTREQALEHNSKMLCAQVNKLVARFIGDPSQGSTKVLPPDLFDLARMAEDAERMWNP